jgi:hypothetical protein
MFSDEQWVANWMRGISRCLTEKSDEEYSGMILSIAVRWESFDDERCRGLLSLLDLGGTLFGAGQVHVVDSGGSRPRSWALAA